MPAAHMRPQGTESEPVTAALVRDADPLEHARVTYDRLVDLLLDAARECASAGRAMSSGDLAAAGADARGLLTAARKVEALAEIFAVALGDARAKRPAAVFRRRKRSAAA
jgi:hypothetical protein